MNRNLKAKIIQEHGTQGDFAEFIDMDESYVSRVIRNRRQLSNEMKAKWAAALNCRIDEIFGTSEER